MTGKTSKAAKKKGKALVKKPNGQLERQDFQQLMKLAKESMDKLEYAPAIGYLKAALEVDANNPEALDMLSALQLECGEGSAAKNTLLKLVEVEPDKGHRRYLSLAQLSEGKESLRWCERAVELLTRQIQNDEKVPQKMEDEEGGPSKESAVSLKRELSNAYCTIVELFTTDLCDEKDAEERCKEFIERSISSDSTNPEAFQCQANYFIITQQHEEAEGVLRHSLSLWLPQYSQAMKEGAGDVSVPSQSARIACSKMLIEMEMFDEATEVLEGLANEDDEMVDTWYLLGWLNYLRGSIYLGNARYYLKKARQVASTVGFEDVAELEHIEELLDEIGDESSDEEGEGEGNEGGTGEDSWTDASSSEDECDDHKMET